MIVRELTGGLYFGDENKQLWKTELQRLWILLLMMKRKFAELQKKPLRPL